MDLVGVAMGYAEVYALTDTANAIVGGSQTARVYFDGDPFPGDDQLANGDPTLHDRALAMIRVAIVNMDRLHADPASSLLVDSVTLTGATPVRGHTLSTTSAAYTVIGLRTALRSLSSQLQLYSNNTPDTAVGVHPARCAAAETGVLNVSFSQRAEQLLRAHGEPPVRPPHRRERPRVRGLGPPHARAGGSIRHARRAHRRDPRPVRRLPRDRRDALSRPRDGGVRTHGGGVL